MKVLYGLIILISMGLDAMEMTITEAHKPKYGIWHSKLNDWVSSITLCTGKDSTSSELIIFYEINSVKYIIYGTLDDLICKEAKTPEELDALEQIEALDDRFGTIH